MLIPVSELFRYWSVRTNGVLHIGAHLGEEASEYKKFDWQPVIWVEAQPMLAEQLKLKLDRDNNRIIQAAVWERDNVRLQLKVASNSMSSSLLEFGSHSKSYPEITYIDTIEVVTQRLDSILSDSEVPNFVNLDIQGTELPALKSLGKFLNKVDYIYVEVNRREVYKGCTKIADLDSFMSSNEFKRITTRWQLKEGWGDALYIRKSQIKKQTINNFFSSRFLTMVFYLKQALYIMGVHKLRGMLKLKPSRK